MTTTQLCRCGHPLDEPYHDHEHRICAGCGCRTPAARIEVTFDHDYWMSLRNRYRALAGAAASCLAEAHAFGDRPATRDTAIRWALEFGRAARIYDEVSLGYIRYAGR